MKLLRLLLYPFSILYGGIVWLRNKFFDWGILSSKAYAVPVICVGNLNVGGTGKTPMIEYLINFLKDKYDIATLSRGYGRKTKGFRVLKTTDSAQQVGDEPLQFKRKFPNITIAVDEKRVHGINTLLELNQATSLILLDDAYQHRYVNAGFNILLTAYNDLYTEDTMLPTGNLREPKIGAKRADVVIVTKCPHNLLLAEQSKIEKQLNLESKQTLCFSTIVYANKVTNGLEERLLKALNADKFTLVTGIANPKPLVAYLKKLNLDFEHLEFPDHHNFSEKDSRLLVQKKLILTTEKDFTRLQPLLPNTALFYLPIKTVLLNESDFKNSIAQFLKTF